MKCVERVGRRGRIRLAVDLAQMLAAGGLDQPVDGVVGIVGARLDALVAEVDRLLRVVVDMRDVAHRVVGVGQVLQPFAAPERLQAVRRKVSGSYSYVVMTPLPYSIRSRWPLAL